MSTIHSYTSQHMFARHRFVQTMLSSGELGTVNVSKKKQEDNIFWGTGWSSVWGSMLF